MRASSMIGISLMLAGCSGLTIREKTLRNMAAAGTAGVLMGQAQSSYKQTHSLLYGSLFAAGAAAATLYFSEDEVTNQRLKLENEKLRSELDAAFAPKVEALLPGTLGGKVPAKYRGLIEPGEWRVMKIDEWVEDGENRLIHQDKVMELTPPMLRPKSIPLPKKEDRNET